MRRILVTGGCGYIGSHLVVQLIRRGYAVTVLDNFATSRAVVLDRIYEITGTRPKFIKIDIRDRFTITDMYDAVIHLAGLKSITESYTYPLQYYNNNVTGSMNLIYAIQHSGIKNIIFSSSATVYGTSSNTKIPETAPIALNNHPYAQTKVIVETLLHDVYNTDSDISVGILRYFNPAGAHPSGLIGEDPLSIPNNLLPYISQVAVGKKDCLTIYGNDYPTPDGTCIRDYIHVMDLVDGHIAVLERMFNCSGYYVYNLGSGKGSSVNQVVDTYNSILDKPIVYRYGPRRQGDLAEYIADITKAEKELNWKVKYTIDDIVKDAYRWERNNTNL